MYIMSEWSLCMILLSIWIITDKAKEDNEISQNDFLISYDKFGGPWEYANVIFL